LDKPTKRYNIPIWLSKWTFTDKQKKLYTLNNYIVKGRNKGEIFTNKKIVNKAVNKLKLGKRKGGVVAVNLSLLSQHGFGINDN
tara:strand:+ start:991 stop:1242 length:252 start_codon:yes stop_codon:yes gene_type:complete